MLTAFATSLQTDQDPNLALFRIYHIQMLVSEYTRSGLRQMNSTTPASSGRFTFRWTASEGMVALGTLPGEADSAPTPVSADGRIVVGTSGEDSIIWDPVQGMRAFRAILPSNPELK